MFDIKNTQLEDLDFACQLYHEAIAYQKKNGYPEYKWDDRAAQKECIEKGLHFKVIVENEIAAVFNIQYSDKCIWLERDQGNSIYLHGVLVNPKYKGQRLFGTILQWTIQKVESENKSNIRLDTWFDNPVLIKYYNGFGFKNIDSFQHGDTEDVALNCRGNKAILMEYNIQENSHINHLLPASPPVAQSQIPPQI